MKQILLLTLFLCTHHISAQQVSYRINSEAKICEDSGETYIGAENWEIFQTDNDQITGTKKLLCFEYSESDRSFIPLGAEEGRPIFFETIEPLDLEVASDNIYSLSTSIRSHENLICDCVTECSQSICNEVKVILKGDINGISYRDTISALEAGIGNFNSTDNINFEPCFVTPSFDQTTIEKLIITVFPQQILPEYTIRINTFFFTDMEQNSIYIEDATFVNHIIPDQFRLGVAYVVGPTFFTELQEDFYFGHVKVLNPNQSDPTNNDFFYYDITPEDSTQQKIINIINTSFSQLVFQKDAQLRGALVALPDNDSLRHRVNLVNDGADMCFPPFVELIIGGEDAFRFRSGRLEFANDWSCMQFREDAKLVVETNAHLHYGKQGIGLLSLRPGASIAIEDNASMLFDGQLIMPDNNESLITITLEENQSLSFSSHASIKTFQPNAKLSIYMKGGNLDTSQLRPEYHQYLDIIYPEQLTSNPKSIVIYPNPASEILSIYVSDDNINSQAIIYDQVGNQAAEEINLSHRINEIDISGLQPGLYYIRHGSGEVIKVVVK